MRVDWDELVRQFEASLRLAQSEAAEDGQAALAPSAEAVASLNRKLIEIHSRLKALDEELGGLDPSTQSPAAAAAAAAVSPARLQPHLMGRLVGHCRALLVQRGRGQTHALAAQLLAELGRSAGGRALCLRQSVTQALAGVLGEAGEDADHIPVETVVQICRILGNLCFDCPEGRTQVMASECLQHLHAIASKRKEVQLKDLGQRLPVILPGFLFNFCHDSPDSIEKAGQVGLIDVIVDNVLSTQTNDAVFNASLNFFVVVAEEDRGHIFLEKSPNFARALNHILVHTTSPEVTETTLELIKSIAEDANLSLELAKSPLCSTLVQRIEGKWRSSEFQEQRNNGCDLLVLILSHDASMKIVYKANDGKLFQTFLKWLEVEDVQLKTTAMLGLGDFACNEDHCMQLMESKTSKTLINVLKSHMNPHTDLKLQHAALGALRNLAVTVSARKQLLEQGLLEPCQKLIETLSVINAQPVVFKLLGTVRLVIDGSPESAQKLGKNGAVIGKLVDWGNSDTQGVKSETARLLAALVKHGNSTEVMNVIVECGGLPHITTMIMSSHVRMLNEAIISLCMMASTLDEETVHAHLHTDLVINGLKNALSHANHPKEVKQNTLTLALALLKAKTELFKSMLQDMDFGKVLQERAAELGDLTQYRDLAQALELPPS